MKADILKSESPVSQITALSNAANDRGYSINFDEVYEKGYRLGSVEETSNYQWTEGNVSAVPMQGIEFTIHGDTSRAALYVKPSGFVSDEEIRQYLDTLSSYLSQQ